MRLAEKSSSSSRAKDEVSTTDAEPTILADNATTIATLFTPRAATSSPRGIVIRESTLQQEQTQIGSRRKGKEEIEESPCCSF